MKTIVILDTLKKYLPAILYSVLGLVAVFLLYKIIIRLRSGGLTIGGIVADKAENEIISKETGLSTSRIQKMRSVAHDVAYELETLKDMGFFDKATHLQFDSDTLEILNNIKSKEEIVCVSNFYENIFTNNRRLLDDLKDVLSANNLNKVPYISALY